MKRAVLLLLAIACIGVTASAQPAEIRSNPKLKQAREELRGAMADYAKTDILPDLLKWKTQFDAGMNQDDLIALEALRKKAAALRADAETSMRTMRNAWKDENYTVLKSSRENLKHLAAERKNLFEDLKPIAVKYKESLIKIGETAKPRVDEWREHGKTLFHTWMEKYGDVLGEDGKHMTMGMARRHGGPFGPLEGMDKEGRKKMAAARFLLWDGSDFTEHIRRGAEGGEMLQPGQNGAPGRAGFGLNQTYPNPVGPASGNGTTIQFSIPANELTTVTVYDSNGKEVAALVNEELSAGEHFVVFDPERLPNGMYFVHLDSGDLSDIKPLNILK